MSRKKAHKRSDQKRNAKTPNIRLKDTFRHPNYDRNRSFSHNHQANKNIKIWFYSIKRFLHWLRQREYLLAITLREYLLAFISNTVTLFLFTLIGLNAPANSIPLFVLIHHYQILSVIIIVICACYILRVIFVHNTSEGERSSAKKDLVKKHKEPWILVNIISYIGSILFLSMLVLILIRPQWCPSILCPSQQIIRVFHQQGNHDDNLEVYFIATQSKSYAIPGDPAQYSQANLPTSIAAIPANGQNSMLSYHLILGLQNLRQEASFGLIIEEVNIVIQKVFPIPYPLNVWNSNLLNDYSNSNQYRGLYFGQDIGSLIPTNYLRFPNGFVHLNPGETDQIDLHIISRTEAGIGFYVQVIYRNDNEQRVYTLKLTQLFEIMFANTIDWYLYLFQNGHFIKSP